MYQCANCGSKACRGGGSLPVATCPGNNEKLREQSHALYDDAENQNLALNAAAVEAAGYGQKTRIEEIIDYARRCGFTKLGLLFCIGLADEAKQVETMFRVRGFDLVSVVCKNGGFSKSSIGITAENTLSGNAEETMCNPIGQAFCLNEQHTELNILLGLCVGHDVLATKYLAGPVTTLAVKDRVTGHNPLAAVYLAHSYYKRLLKDDRNT